MSVIRTKKTLNISLTERDKNKSKQFGFNSVFAFLIDSAKSNFRLNIDMSVYRKLTHAIDAVGRNINSVVRRIHLEKSIPILTSISCNYLLMTSIT